MKQSILWLAVITVSATAWGGDINNADRAQTAACSKAGGIYLPFIVETVYS
jgi:hypothetical protein